MSTRYAKNGSGRQQQRVEEGEREIVKINATIEQGISAFARWIRINGGLTPDK